MSNNELLRGERQSFHNLVVQRDDIDNNVLAHLPSRETTASDFAKNGSRLYQFVHIQNQLGSASNVVLGRMELRLGLQERDRRT